MRKTAFIIGPTTKKLSSIEDQSQTDRDTALPRPYTLEIDLWP